jgi:hypothetical protein
MSGVQAILETERKRAEELRTERGSLVRQARAHGQSSSGGSRCAVLSVAVELYRSLTMSALCSCGGPNRGKYDGANCP